jgi:uncharacterized SAM-binding protein YcdF (DUF218 family)
MFRGHRRLIALTVAGVLVVAWVAASARLFVWPPTDQPAPADAVVVFAGGGDRAERGVELVRDGYADTVVFASAFVEDQDVWAVRYCNYARSEVPGEVLCFEPDPGTTRGEARATADLAEERGWDEILLVVSTDQAERARMLVDRCWDGEVKVIEVAHSQPRIVRVFYEWGATAKALTVNRGC